MRRRRWTDTAITAYLDGRMRAEERAAFEAALAADESLREQVEALRQVKQLLAAMPMREPPRSYRLTPAMVAEQRGKPRRVLTFHRLAPAMAMVLLVAMGLLWMLRTPLSRQVAAPPPQVQTFGEEPALEAAPSLHDEQAPARLREAPQPEEAPMNATFAEAGKTEQPMEETQQTALSPLASPLRSDLPTATPETSSPPASTPPHSTAPGWEWLLLLTLPLAGWAYLRYGKRGPR